MSSFRLGYIYFLNFIIHFSSQLHHGGLNAAAASITQIRLYMYSFTHYSTQLRILQAWHFKNIPSLNHMLDVNKILCQSLERLSCVRRIRQKRSQESRHLLYGSR